MSMENSRKQTPEDQTSEQRDLQADWLELMAGDIDDDDQGLAPSVPQSIERYREMEKDQNTISGNNWDND